LILLSDVDGLYTKNPKLFKDAKLIKKIENFNKDLRDINFKGVNEFGSGGMDTKIEAAKICQLSGCDMIIGNGLYLSPIDRIIKKNNHSLFVSKVSKLDARKKWIISSVSPKGELLIDDGAKKALKSGKSLLAAGIKEVNGKFNKGDHIKILDKSKKEYARGLSSFSSIEIKKILGQHSKEIEKILGYTAKSEVVHKDDLVEI
jgi:glutamate 5-kinase